MRLQPDDRAPARPVRPRVRRAVHHATQPVIFAYHGYPSLIHRLTYRRANHHNLHVRGYKEEGTTTTPFDMVMLNDLDRFHLVIDVIDRVPGLGERAAGLRQEMVDARLRARAYTRELGDDPPEVRDWTWPGGAAAPTGAASDSTDARARSSPSTPARAASSCAWSATTTQSWPSASWPRRRRQVDPDALRAALAGRLADADAVAHRIVHGGERFRGDGLIDDDGAGARCDELTDLAPLHQPKSLAALDAGLGAAARTSRRSPASTPRFTRRCRRPRSPTRCPPAGASAGGCAATASTGSRTPGSPARAAELLAGGDGGARGSSPATSARARRCARSPAGARSTRRWASRRSRAWSWRPGRAASTRGCCCGCWSARRSTEREMACALEHESGLAGPGRRRRHARRCCSAPATARRRRRSRSTSTCTGCGRGSPRWRPRWAASTCSSSPAASASRAADPRPCRRRARVPRRRGRRERNEQLDGDAEIAAPGAPVRTLVLRAREDLEMAGRSAGARAGTGQVRERRTLVSVPAPRWTPAV